MNDFFEIDNCEVCGSANLTPVLDLNSHPMCDDLIPIGIEEQNKKFPIEILFCKNCSTAHQRYQIPKKSLFPLTYHYRSRFTADVLTGMTALTDSVVKKIGPVDGLVVLDVGCNDGSLLDKFMAKGAKTIGIEPTGAYIDAEGRGHVIINDFFTETSAKKIIESQTRVDIITFTNVFAHIENLPTLLKALSFLMNDDTVLVIENHYLGAVFSRNQFDTFYHEHPRTYSLLSFIHIAKTLERKVINVEFPQRYGGNIRVMIGNARNITPEVTSSIEMLLKEESGFLEQFISMRLYINSWKKEKRSEIDSVIREHGKIVAKAFPGRAAILVELLGLTENEVECVYEKPGSLKIGHYLPGTRIPIRSDNELFERINSIKVLLNLAWHIPKEIENYLRENGYTGRLIHVV